MYSCTRTDDIDAQVLKMNLCCGFPLVGQDCGLTRDSLWSESEICDVILIVENVKARACIYKQMKYKYKCGLFD